MVPISEVSLDYAQQVRSLLRKAKLHVDVDSTDRKMQKKVREAQLAQYNYILVSNAPLNVPVNHCDGLRPVLAHNAGDVGFLLLHITLAM